MIQYVNIYYRKLAGRTIFITGASRGIGKSIAVKAAKDGANVVIAAKTAEPHPKLPGTIYTAAAESNYFTFQLVQWLKRLDSNIKVVLTKNIIFIIHYCNVICYYNIQTIKKKYQFVLVEQAGGKALPCIVDVRNEAQVVSAVENAVNKFGGIDVVINNASAISLTDTAATDMKKYDLMNNINTRGTFLV